MFEHILQQEELCKIFYSKQACSSSNNVDGAIIWWQYLQAFAVAWISTAGMFSNIYERSQILSHVLQP